jgi:hypothetical protein
MRQVPGRVLVGAALLALAPAAFGQTLYITSDMDVNGTWDNVIVGKDATLTQNSSPKVRYLGGAVNNMLRVFNSSLLEIQDGTSNTILFSETSQGAVSGGTNTGFIGVGGASRLEVTDGTSNTILFSETGRGVIGGGSTGTIGVSGSGLATITDGTSNTILISEGGRAVIGGGAVAGSIQVGDNGFAEITDGTSNTIILSESGAVDLRGGDLQGGTIFLLGDGSVRFIGTDFSATNPTPGTYGAYTGTYYDFWVDFGSTTTSGRYFLAELDGGGNPQDPQVGFQEVPEPGSVALFGSLTALFVLLRGRARRSRAA